jgi:hypothetical protein
MPKVTTAFINPVLSIMLMVQTSTSWSLLNQQEEGIHFHGKKQIVPHFTYGEDENKQLDFQLNMSIIATVLKSPYSQRYNSARNEQ